MRKISTLIIVCMMTLLFLVTGVNATDMGSENIKMIGATVRNLEGEVLGSITELERDIHSNTISFAVLSHGNRLIPVPINALTFTDNEATLDVTKEMLASAPGFEMGKRPDMSDSAFSDAVHRYYGIRPSWVEEEGMEETSGKNPWSPYNWPRLRQREY